MGLRGMFIEYHHYNRPSSSVQKVEKNLGGSKVILLEKNQNFFLYTSRYDFWFVFRKNMIEIEIQGQISKIAGIRRPFYMRIVRIF